MTNQTPDPITNDTRVMVRQTATGFEQGIAAGAGFLTAGPLGAVASWGALRGLQGKWAPWTILGFIGAPVCIGIQVATLAAIGGALDSVQTPTQTTSAAPTEQLAPAAPVAPVAPVAPPAPATLSNTPSAFTKTCWSDNTQGKFVDFPCNVTRRVNNNGHIVWDIEWDDAGQTKTSVVLWTDGTVEYFEDGEKFVGTHTESDGYTVVQSGNYTFAF